MFSEFVSEIKEIVDALRIYGLDEVVLKPRDKRMQKDSGALLSFYDVTCECLKNTDLEFEYDSGATKGVIIPLDADYVIKIPLYTTRGEGPVDFCAREVEVYEKAKKFGLNHMLAAVQVFKFDDVPYYVYVQEKADVNTDENEDVLFAYSSEKIAKEDYDDEDERNSAAWEYMSEMPVEECIYAIFGEYNKYAGKLINLFNDMNVNDIHCGNFGYNGGHPVLIDYSGY